MINRLGAVMSFFKLIKCLLQKLLPGPFWDKVCAHINIFNQVYYLLHFSQYLVEWFVKWWQSKCLFSFFFLTFFCYVTKPHTHLPVVCSKNHWEQKKQNGPSRRMSLLRCSDPKSCSRYSLRPYMYGTLQPSLAESICMLRTGFPHYSR